ncbi:hypothetical protein NWFMUON74_69030 [Nocardia wallacei]|uniref:Carrier domain-containing protein n=1 Tax=Nocardia wallacei TaxID=480035 RepID=A0A7G1KW72_9NOCA|nr:hypothetical protein NWFMUON74_69030 [Nocardia wallacei]
MISYSDNSPHSGKAPETPGERIPLTAAQMGVWHSSQLLEAPMKIAMYIEVIGELDLTVLESAGRTAGHEMGSGYIRIGIQNEEPYQVVDLSLYSGLDYFDLRNSADPIADAHEWMERDAARRIDLVRDRLIRNAILRVGDGHWLWYMAAHHIVLDGFGAMNLVERTAHLYTAMLTGREPQSFAAGSIRDMVDSDVSYRNSRRFEVDHAYWRDRVSGYEERSTPFRTQANASASPIFFGSELPDTVSASTRSAATRLTASESELFIAAFASYLARVSDSGDVMLSLPVAARTTAVLRRSAGMLSNIVPLRLAVDRSVAISELLRRVRLGVTGALRHQRYRYEDIRRETVTKQRPFGISFGPRINISPIHMEIRLGAAAGQVNVLSTGGVDDLTVSFYRSVAAPRYRVDFEARAGLYSEDEVGLLHGRFLEYFDRFVRAAGEDLTWDIPLVGDRERQRILSLGTGPAVDSSVAPETTTLASLFAAHAHRTPSATAVRFADENLSYAQFAAHVHRLARYLVRLGVGPETMVAVQLRRSLELVIAVHAIAAAGGAYVPVDPDHPADRNRYVLESTRPVCMVTTTQDRIDVGVDIDVVELDRLDLSTYPDSPISDSDRTAPLRPANAAYVIFTSGSTGRPKGVAVSHGAIVNRLSWMQADYPLTAADSVLQKTPATFDVSVWELFWPLWSGARLVVARPDGHRDPAYLADVIVKEQITVIHFVPSMLAQFLATPAVRESNCLRMVFASGEALPAADAQRLTELTGAALHNLYGPTEAAIEVTAHPVTAADTVSVPIGRPALETQIYVLDSRLHPVPAGIAGELYLAGAQLARGYVSRADLTADRFVANPFGTGERMYRTGDLVTWTITGELEYLGRTDLQVKLRGVRIEPREIESALTTIDSIIQAAVAVHTDARRGDQLVAYIVTESEGETAALRTELATRLPAALVPSVFVVLEALPVNAAGKLDRAALPAPLLEPRGSRQVETPGQRIVAEIFTEVLGVERIGADDNFFELGGNSLSGAQVVARLTDAFGTRTTVRDLFEAPTVAMLAEHVESAATEPPRIPLEARPRPARIPLAPAQRRMWLLNQLDPTSPVDNMPLAIRLSGELNVPALEHAARDLVTRHEILRTRYPETPEGPVQQVLPPDAVRIDLEPHVIDAERVSAAVDDLVGAGFDVTIEVPFRLRLFRTAATEYILVAVVHHISADGWSMLPLTRDLMAAYTSRCRNEMPTWSPLPVQYSDYSIWQRALLGSEDDPDSLLSTQAEFWRRALAGLPDEIGLPTTRPRPPARSFRGGRVRFRIGADLDKRLRQFAHRQDVTYFMVVHTAFAVLLARLSGNDDVALGAPIAGRGEAELDGLVGMFVNTLVLRTQVSRELTFIELLARTRAADLEAFAHADIPFEQLVDMLRPQRSPARHPLFQVALVFDNTPDSTFQLHGLRITPVDLGSGAAKFDLTLSLRESADTGSDLAATFSFARDLYDEATIEVFAQRFVRLLSAIVAEPDIPVGDLPILSAEEYRLLTAGPCDQDAATGLLPDLMTHGLRLGRDRIALRAAGTSMTYGALDESSSRLARALIAAGVGPETVVAVAYPRSHDLVVAVLAIAKAGGAYLPIDPAYPAERIRHMLTDSVTVLGLTSSEHIDSLPGDVPWLALDDPATVRSYADMSSAPVDDSDRRAPLRTMHAAYVIFTSGSTGKPKGVTVTHGGLAGLVRELTGVMRVTPDHRFLNICSPSFDPSLLEWLCALHSGATLLIAPPELVGGPDLAEFLRTEQVTHVATTPGVLATMEPDGLDQLIALGIGGDLAAAELVDKWAPGRTLFNFYGPTETTIVSSYTRLTPGNHITIGRPVRGMSALVLDSRLHPVPPGVTGELYLAGPGLARAYSGAPGATAERFLPNPWGETGSRMYRTGDLVRWYTGPDASTDNTLIDSVDWRLDFLGRSDTQVKIRGFRIEPSEIDAVLGRHPRVDFAVTIGRRSPAGTTALVSYVLPTSGGAFDPGELVEHAASSLPRHMVPSAVVVLDQLPLTPVGKLDRDALPEPPTPQRDFRAPVGGIEQTIAETFATVLGLEVPVGRDEDFFELGGNSLIATQVVARLGVALDARIPVRLLFEASTVAGLARTVASRVGRGRHVLRRGARPERIPLSPAQQRMWFLNRLDPQSAAYNMPVAVRLSGLLDVEALRAATADLVDRHEVLRTVYPATDGGPVQVILPPDQAVPALVLRSASPDTVEAAVRELASVGFDVTTEVPVRVALIEISNSSDTVEPSTETAVPPTEYVLAMVIHHIAGDGSSMTPLARDLLTAYAARSAGTAPSWAPLAVQYADYTMWQRMLLGDEGDPASAASRQIAYWKQALAGLPDQLALPADHPRPVMQTFKGARIPVAIDAETHHGLTELARSQDATLFMVLHTAFAVLLARLSGSNDIAIGTPTAGRGEPELDHLIGMFVNTLVFRTRVDTNETFTQLLARQRETDIEAYAHADVPFERLVEILNPPRSTARHPLFQVGLSFQNLRRTSLELPGLTVSEVDFDSRFSQFDLHLIVSDGYDESGAPAGLHGAITYATDLFDAATVERFAERYERLLREIATTPWSPVGDLDLMCTDERAAVVSGRNATEHDLDVSLTLVSLFARTVSKTPDAVALVSPAGETVTYGEVGDRVNRLARHLVSLGVRPESRVALAFHRSVDLVVAMYAVAVAGGAYVPVDPNQPTERTGYVLRIVDPVCVLTTSSTAADSTVVSGAATAGMTERLVLVDKVNLSMWSGAPVDDAQRVTPLHPANTAYVIFTSGSTGRPKGVAVPHAAVVNQLLWKMTALGLSADDVILLKTAATFDLSVWEFWTAPVTGCRVVIAAADGHRDPAYLNSLMAREGVTTLHAVPSMLDALLTVSGDALAPSLRRVLAIGDVLPGAVAQRFRSAHPTVSLVNLYGPTEATVSVTSHTVTDADQHSVPIGAPEWNNRVYVLDSRLHPVPDGVAGELYIAGSQLAREYFGRADLTAVRMVANPFEPGARMYRTGDLVAWNAEGELNYHGRTDFQVKIRGFRIEPGEIEAVLLRLPEIAQAVVLAISAGHMGDRLVAYLVPADAGLDVDRVKAELSSVLPSYLVPSTFVVLDMLPLNMNGKLDRNALPDPEFERITYRAPSTPTEYFVARVFAEVLGAEQVGADDDFFALGGNSLLATQVVARLGADLNTQVPVGAVFEAPTVAGLAVRAAKGTYANRLPELTAGRPRPERIPLSPAQQRMWILNQIDTTSPVYNIPVALRLTGDLNPAALRDAVAEVIMRHEILRTVYPAWGETAHQLILPTTEILSDLTPEPVSADKLLDRITEMISTGFDVATEVPFRVGLFRIESDGISGEYETQHVLAFVAHHIAVDGWSLRPLTRDVMAAYAAHATGRTPVWPAPAVQYADFSCWQRDVLGSEDDPHSLISEQIEYWRAALAGLPLESTFPTDRPRPAAASRAGGTVAFTIDARTTQGLRELARAHGASMFMVVHTALAVLLARLSGMSDVAIGTPIAGRGIGALDDSIGMFVNTLVLRTRLDPAQPFTEVLAQQRDSDLSAFSHADVPFDRVVDSLDLPRHPSRSPLFQVALSFQNFPSEAFELPGVRTNLIDLPVGTEMFDITVVLDAGTQEGAMIGSISYARDLFDIQTAHQLGERLLLILRTVVAEPATAVGDIALLLPGEADRTRHDADLLVVNPSHNTLVDLIDARIREQPENIAVRAGAQSITYAELSRRADTLAHLLISHGVQPGSVVAVGLDRSVWVPITLLAVLRAGAAYVSLEPSYPRPRLEFIMADAGPDCLVTSASLLDVMPSGETPVLLVEDSELQSGVAAPGLPVSITADDLAYVIYTSGTTGVPKGVMVTHRNVVHLLASALRHFDVGTQDVWTVFHSFAFDFAVWELWGALSTGGTAVVVDYITSRTPDMFRDLLVREHVTVLSQTPSAFYQLDQADRSAAADDSPLALRYVVFGGEALELYKLAGWFERYADSAPCLINMYGITETTVHVTIEPLARHMVTVPAVGSPIGRGLPGIGVHVLDNRLHPVPTGTTGEAYVTGPQVARGYLGQAGLTAARFVADPFGPPGARLYRSGDLVRRTAQRLEYLRRADHQVQLRGFRIELGEIEAVLGRFGDVKVIVRDGRLLAYARGVDPAGADELRRTAVQHLPEHMVPAAVTVVDRWPMTVNGKLDSRALPEPDFAALSTARAPRNDRERALAAIFCEVLGLTDIGIDDDFFQMGGDSLSAVRLRARIRHILAVDVQVQDIFELRTVAGLATVSARPPGLPARADSVRAATLPLSYPQRRLLDLNAREQFERGPGRAYVLQLRLHGATPPDVVAQAFTDLTMRHEVLRTVFPGAQLVLDDALDFETVLTDDIPAATAACIAQPFDLQTEVPLRVRLYPDDDSDLLLIILHHIAADGWSLTPLVHDVATALLARRSGARPDWRPLPMQYAEHAIWQRRITESAPGRPVVDAELNFWRHTLADLPTAARSARHIDSSQPYAERVFLYIPPERYRRSMSYAARHDASVFMVVHTAVVLTLREFGYGNDITVCAPTAGRTEVGMEEMIGRFTNFLVLRTEVHDDPDFTHLLERVRVTTLAAMDNQDIPFEYLTDSLGIGDRLRIRLAFQNIPTSDLRRAGLSATWEPVEVPTPADWDISFILSEEKDAQGRPRALYGYIEYVADSIDASTAQRMASSFDSILSAGIGADDAE